MLQHEIDGQAAIRAVYGAPITYTGDGASIEGLIAIRSDTPPETEDGFSGRAARVSFEIDKADLPDEPARGHTIVEASGTQWSVIDSNADDALGVWIVFVEDIT